jgi:hypothetical protein
MITKRLGLLASCRTATRVAVFLDEVDALGHGVGADIEIGHGMDGVAGLRLRRRGDDEGREREMGAYDPSRPHDPSRQRVG